MTDIPSIEALLKEGGTAKAGPAPTKQRRAARGPKFIRHPELEEQLWRSFQENIYWDHAILTEEDAQTFRRECLDAERYLSHDHEVRVTTSLEMWEPGQTSEHPVWIGRASNRATWQRRPEVSSPVVFRFRLCEVDPRYAQRSGGYGAAEQIRSQRKSGGGEGVPKPRRGRLARK